MIDLDDVDSGFVDLGGDRCERSRLIVRCNVQPGDPSLANEIANEHVGKEVRVDIAPA